MIGNQFILDRAMLGAKVGDIGYVFNEYSDFDGEGFGVQIIFPNGNYDGFSVREQALYLTYDGHIPEYSHYKFSNVIQVSRDFRKGFWVW